MCPVTSRLPDPMGSFLLSLLSSRLLSLPPTLSSFPTLFLAFLKGETLRLSLCPDRLPSPLARWSKDASHSPATSHPCPPLLLWLLPVEGPGTGQSAQWLPGTQGHRASDGSLFSGRAVVRPGCSSRLSLGFLPSHQKHEASALQTVTKMMPQSWGSRQV